MQRRSLAHDRPVARAPSRAAPFDYVWLIEPPGYDPQPDPRAPAEVWRSGTSVLYRVVDRTPVRAARGNASYPIRTVHAVGPSLSIVVPCYNEEACLAELHRRLAAAAQAAAGDVYEIVLVNDGSRDRSWAMMQALAETDPQLVAINLSRNHGHQLALTAGLDLCARRAHPDHRRRPAGPARTARRHGGGDGRAEGRRRLCRAPRPRRRDRVQARHRQALLPRSCRKLAEIEIPLDTGDFRLMSRRALDALLSLPEQARFIRGMVAWVGFRQVPILYDRAERHAGETKYPLSKMVRLAVDAVTGFSTAPLALRQPFRPVAGRRLGAAARLYRASASSPASAIQGWTSLMLVVVILGAVQMFVLGMIGEYLGRLYIEAKRRPLYIVSDIAGHAGAHAGASAMSLTKPTAIAASDTPGGNGSLPIAWRSSPKSSRTAKLTGLGGSASPLPSFRPAAEPARATAAAGNSRQLK